MALSVADKDMCLRVIRLMLKLLCRIPVEDRVDWIEIGCSLGRGLGFMGQKWSSWVLTMVALWMAGS